MYSSINRRSVLKIAAAATATSTLGALSLPAIAFARPAVASARAMRAEPGAGAWRTWFLSAGSDLRLPPPPDSMAELSVVRGMLSMDA
jgi:TAT (twin-arginine translocation) pathway signal sequence